MNTVIKTYWIRTTELMGIKMGEDTLDDTIRGLIYCVQKPLKPLLYQGKME